VTTVGHRLSPLSVADGPALPARHQAKDADRAMTEPPVDKVFRVDNPEQSQDADRAATAAQRAAADQHLAEPTADVRTGVTFADTSAPVPEPAGAAPGLAGGVSRRGDRIFSGMTRSASGFVILLVLLIAAFLLIKAIPAIIDDKDNFLTSTQFDISSNGLRFGIAGLLYTTLLISLVALVIALPLAIGIALFITQYAPARLSRPIAYVIDLLAAIPSIIYGVWGIRELAPELAPVQRALYHIPLGFFADKGIDVGTVFDGGVVLAVMILPIITAVSRDVFDRTPTENKEAALALGATRWEMIRIAVLPFGRPGVISGAMLGLGRALGETIAVLLILSTVSEFSFSLFSGGTTFASLIASGAGEFGDNPGPYIAAGLILFALTFIVNGVARSIVNRRRDFA
jgi:phosphate transport system permease protein